MDPGTLAITSAVAGGASTGLNVFSSLSGAEAKAGQMEYQAGVARLNKQIALQNADWTRRAGEVSAQTEGMKTRFQIGQTKAVQSGRGIDISTGSAAAVRESEHDIGLHDQAQIRSNAAHRAYGFEVEAMEKETEAGMLQAGAKQTRKAGMIGAVSSILGGASSVADKWYQYGSTFGPANPKNVGYATSFGT